MPNEEISFADLMASSIHDMKNSVNIQVHVLENLAAQIQPKVDPQTFESLVSVITQAHRMDANMIQLLSLYKFGKSIYPLDISEQSVSEAITEALLQTRAVCTFKGITVAVDCDENLCWYFDRDLITGVLLNALNNAYNYTLDKVLVQARVDGDVLMLRVDDNGRGYPAHMLQGHGLDANKGVSFTSGSTGLGFYFSAQVAQLHQNQGRSGSLTIENGGAYGGGCFVLSLP